MSDWISVKEKLPDENTQVLGFNGGRMFGSYNIVEIKTDKDGCTAWHVYGVHEYDAGFGCVTHWMLLPSAPHDLQELNGKIVHIIAQAKDLI